MTEEAPSFDDFPGTAPLFPLPNLVLYPQVVQPLHIFEERYREMTRDALAGDKLIAMALLKPGWDVAYECNPGIFPVVCVSRIIADQPLDDGRFNLLVRGLGRGRVVEEVPTGKLYRTGRIELLAETPPGPDTDPQQLHRHLVELLPAWFPGQPKVLAQFEEVLAGDITLGLCCDIIAFALPLPVEFKQQLLEEPDVERRAKTLLARLRQKKSPEPRQFPPRFSDN